MSTEPTHSNPRQRLKALLAIPDSQRTEEQWDEIIELEITLAPGNRIDAPQPGQSRKGPGPAPQSKGGQSKKPFKKFHKRPPKAPAA